MTEDAAPAYPFTAIVGQESLKAALLVNAVDPRVGGVLIQGQRGTAKSTAARALASLLPAIEVYGDNPYHCGPGDEAFAVCDASVPVVQRRARLVDLPMGASEDRVTGTLDLERTLRSGERHFEPGLLAAAHRGVLYIDEVNLLPDHLVDLLLDVAASGVNVVEREGVSVRHPSRFLLVGTMNPEEGELRPQFIDRFGLSVFVTAPTEPADRIEVIRRRLAFDADPTAFSQGWAREESALARGLADARARLREVHIDDALVALLVELCIEAGADGLRADITLHRCATALAALAGRTTVIEDDVYRAALLVLPHRRRSDPLTGEPPGRSLQDIVEEHRERDADDGVAQAPPPPRGSPPGATDEAEPSAPAPEAGDAPEPADAPVPDRNVAPEVASALRLSLDGPRRARRDPARRGRNRAHATSERHGAVVRVRPFEAGATDIAPLATAQQVLRVRAARGSDAELDASMLRVRERAAPLGRLVLFVLDTSGSMGTRDRMAMTKGALLTLFRERYQRRDRVALMTFRDRGAHLTAGPTRDVARVTSMLRDLPTGGQTPLASALDDAARFVRRARSQAGAEATAVVLVTDGRSAQDGIEHAAAALRRSGADLVVVDTEDGFVRLGRARRLAELLGATYRPLTR